MVIFHLKEGFLLKNQSQFNAPSMIRIPTLPDSPLCPGKAIREYLADTQGPCRMRYLTPTTSGSFPLPMRSWQGWVLIRLWKRARGDRPPRSLRNILYQLFHPRLVGLFWPDVGFEISLLSGVSKIYESFVYPALSFPSCDHAPRQSQLSGSSVLPLRSTSLVPPM